MTSSFRALTYRIRIKLEFRQSPYCLTCLLDTAYSQNLVNRDFLARLWRDPMKQTEWPRLQTTICEINNIEGILRLFSWVEELQACTCFTIV